MVLTVKYLNKYWFVYLILQLPVWSPTGDTAPGWMQSAALSADRRYSIHDQMKAQSKQSARRDSENTK